MSEVLIRNAYRILLGREPENDSVVPNLAATYGDSEAILRAFVECAEFKARYRTFLSEITEGFNAPRLSIETDVPPEILNRLFIRIRAQWKQLGEREPYWSVVTSTDYLRSNFDANEAKFRESGRGHAAMVDYLPTRSGIVVRRGTCLELGCGVGRVTRFLAEKFDRVIAVDISPGNLKLSEEYLRDSGISNVDYCLIESPAEIAGLEDFDFFYSIIVLQHNPPPVQKFILSHIFRVLRPGGCALFQIPTFRMNYGFSVDSYLQSPPPEMEMHAMPMHVIFSLFEQHGLHCREVLMDGSTGEYGSHTFVAEKL
jgi:SAM-dependent methyltransferase